MAAPHDNNTYALILNIFNSYNIMFIKTILIYVYEIYFGAKALWKVTILNQTQHRYYTSRVCEFDISNCFWENCR